MSSTDVILVNLQIAIMTVQMATKTHCVGLRFTKSKWKINERVSFKCKDSLDGHL